MTSELVELARLGVKVLIKAEDVEVGRIPAPAEDPSDSPSVPPEQVAESPPERRSPREIIHDAIAVLEEGVRKGALSSADELEVSSAVKYMKKSDTPISVKAVIKDGKGRVLVLRDAYGPWWDLPGGHVQEGESIDDALKREVMEESGLSVQSCNQTETRMLDLGGEVRPVLFYQAECVAGQPRCSEEHIGYQWAGGEDLKGLNLGVFKDILIPGHEAEEVLETGDPASTRKTVGEQQIPHYQVKDGGISGAGDATVGEDVHTPTGGSSGRKRFKSLGSSEAMQNFYVELAREGRGKRTFWGMLEPAVKKNVKLITTMSREQKKDLVKDLLAYTNRHGKISRGKLAKVLQRNYELDGSQAKIIADDQASKLEGATTRITQMQAGINKYVWQTQMDAKVRPTHRARHGRTYLWKRAPAGTGHPGQDINCRCVALPVLQSAKR